MHLAHRHRLFAIRSVTFIGWAAAGVDALTVAPFHLPMESSNFALAVAITGTLALTVRSLARPIIEVYQAGKDVGRREAEREFESAQVLRFDRRRLRRVE
jgi:hypothetical protein